MYLAPDTPAAATLSPGERAGILVDAFFGTGSHTHGFLQHSFFTAAAQNVRE